MSRTRTLHARSEAPASPEALALDAWQYAPQPMALLGSDAVPILTNAAYDQLEASVPAATLASFCRVAYAAGPGHHAVAVTPQLTLAADTRRTPRGLVLVFDTGRETTSAEAIVLDAATGLPDRASFRRRLEAHLAVADASGALVVLRIQRLNAIRESLGESFSEAVLKAAADRLRSSLPAATLVGLLGEHSFVFTVQGSQGDTEELVQRQIDLLSRAYILSGQLLNVWVTAGITLFPTDGTEANQLIRNAGLAMSSAYRDGRSGYRVYAAAMDESSRARRSLETDLRRALALRELRLVYQPQLDLETQAITGFEALLRWHHPERGVVSPADFIPLSEETGLIVPIGEWVLRTACREAALWPDNLSIAVNVSAVQFAHPGLVETAISALADSGLAPERLEVEITESLLLGDHAAALETLSRLKAMGVRISMDDFGTGYSSLSYLRSFPFDTIKIDQSFVRGQAASESGMAIVRAIAALGKSLGMSTIAEGVETEAQLREITENGCTAVQGYFISRPIPPTDIHAFLASGRFGAADPDPSSTSEATTP